MSPAVPTGLMFFLGRPLGRVVFLVAGLHFFSGRSQREIKSARHKGQVASLLMTPFTMILMQSPQRG